MVCMIMPLWASVVARKGLSCRRVAGVMPFRCGACRVVGVFAVAGGVISLKYPVGTLGLLARFLGLLGSYG